MIQQLLLQRKLEYLSCVGALGMMGAIAPSAWANPIDFTLATPSPDTRSVCSAVSAIAANSIKPTIPDSSQPTQDANTATSACAADLGFISPNLPKTPTQQPFSLVQNNPQEESPASESDTPFPASDTSEDLQVTRESDRWHFKFQPYATIPVSTYGTVTARGRTASYSLSLGQLLQGLRMTASGRVEAWKGRWGFIVDGYYVSLQGIGSFEKIATRDPQPINVVDYALSKGINTRVTELATALDREVQALQEVEEIKNSPALQQLDQEVQTLQATLTQDAEDLQFLATNVKSFQETLAQDGQQLQSLVTTLQTSLQDLQLTSDEKKDIGRAIALNSATLLRDEEQVEARKQQLQSLGTIPGVEQVQQDLTQIQNTLEAAEQRVQELRQIEDSPQLQQLETEIANAKTAVEKELQDIEKIKTFQENREPQQLDADVNTDIQFDQGIYDFAVSYHFGPEPSYSYPEKPSERSFPLLWFQAIGGVRLNDINVQIQDDIDYEISSSLVNVQGTVQNTYQAGRTWFEPMLGGKLGLQLSDLWTLWLRGDVSGFGLAGQTDLSWNIFFGVDWWVRKNLSLQAAYRFYEIDYKNGTGDNAFGFSENFNGPFLSATFHF